MLRASWIGSVAWDVLRDDQVVIVSGMTSRGIFLSTTSRWVLFVSAESSRGPLTINLQEDPLPYASLHTGMVVHVSKECLCFSESGISIILEQVPVYSAQLPPEVILKTDLAVARIHSVLDSMSTNSRFLQASPLLSAFIALVSDMTELRASKSQTPPFKTDPYSPALDFLYQSLKLRASESCRTALTNFLGLGQGLTPSGDDLVIGFLLAINCYRLLCPWLTRIEFNPPIIAAAYQRTTNLSANLIECAASGQADERLVDALDGLLSPRMDLNACLSQLANWGNSSGLDALVGMGLVLMES